MLVSLVTHRRQRGLDLAGLHADHLEASRLQTIGQVLGERTGFQTHTSDLDIERPQIADDVFDFRSQLGLRPDIALIVDDTDVDSPQ